MTRQGVLITGAGGQLGQALLATAPDWALPVPRTRAELDITDAEAVAAAAGAQSAIINAAAYTAVDQAESDRARAFAVNETGPALLARHCRQHGQPLIHVSTDYVFNGRASRPYRPDAPSDPLGVYGASKLAGEQAILKTGGNAIILRTAWLYAAAGRNFLTTMLRHMRAGRELRVVNDQIGSPTPCRQLAEAIWQTLDHIRADPRPCPEIHHYTASGQTSWHGFATRIAEELRAHAIQAPMPVAIPTSEYPTSAARPAMSVLDCDATCRRFGLAQTAWQDGLHATLAEALAEEQP